MSNYEKMSFDRRYLQSMCRLANDCEYCLVEQVFPKHRCGHGNYYLEKPLVPDEEVTHIMDLLHDFVQDPDEETEGEAERSENAQTAKADSGKPRPSLVPKQIIYSIEKVREFGTSKYKDPDNWKNVDIDRFWQATLRHALTAWNDPHAKDEESGLLAIEHIACNVAFILELMAEGKK